MKNAEVYVSVDVETDGPIPGPNSMLSLGAAAFHRSSKSPIATFSVNFMALVGASPDEETMAWWHAPEQAAAWDATTVDRQFPAEAIKRFVSWVENLPGIVKKSSGAVSNAVFVGYPAGFDFTFTYWYIKRFGVNSPFSFSALDIKTLAMAALGTSFRESVKRNMPASWFPKDRPHTHVAVDDAIEQGILCMNILNALDAARGERT